jgi:CelD/BcsL family acetyltransferase involved in cellulose biosynthesis
MTAFLAPSRRTGSGIAVIHPAELGPAEVAAWHGMQRAAPSLANPFLSPEFAMAVGSFRPQARVAILSEGQAITGFFPFERRSLGLGVPVGGWLSGAQGLVSAPGTEWDPQRLLRGCGLAAWQFDSLVEGQQPLLPYQTAVKRSPVIDLTDGFESYSAKLSVNAHRFCRELARKARKLGREAGELRIVADSRDSAALSVLMAWKSEQYRRTRQVDRFEHKWVRDLLQALLAGRGEHADGQLSVLYAGDQPVAVQFGLRAGPVLSGWFTGYDINFARYSPGLIQLLQMAEKLAADGVTTIHMGNGALRYTENLKNDEVLVAAGTATSRSLLGTAHGARGVSAQWALRTVRRHPGLHHAADRVLRLSGISRRTYGRL